MRELRIEAIPTVAAFSQTFFEKRVDVMKNLTPISGLTPHFHGEARKVGSSGHGDDRKSAILRHRPWASPRSGPHRLLPIRRKREPDHDRCLRRHQTVEHLVYQNLEWFPDRE
jgi:hypothetical protein